MSGSASVLDDRASCQQLIEFHDAPVDGGNAEGLQDVAYLDEAVDIRAVDQPATLVDVDLQIFGPPSSDAFSMQILQQLVDRILVSGSH